MYLNCTAHPWALPVLADLICLHQHNPHSGHCTDLRISATWIKARFYKSQSIQWCCIMKFQVCTLLGTDADEGIAV